MGASPIYTDLDSLQTKTWRQGFLGPFRIGTCTIQWRTLSSVGCPGRYFSETHQVRWFTAAGAGSLFQPELLVIVIGAPVEGKGKRKRLSGCTPQGLREDLGFGW